MNSQTETIDPREEDPVNLSILEKRLQARELLEGPQVGDFIRMKDGSLRRFAHRWEDGMQTNCHRNDGSFYLYSSGRCSYSGALRPIIPFEDIRPTSAVLFGFCWIFDHNIAGKGRGVTFNTLFPVYEEV